jgi:hypothetical protein
MQFSLTGLLEEILLTDVARFIHAARQTGVLGITSNKVRGAIYFDRGNLVDAESHESFGLAALDQLAVFTEGSFQWYDAVRSPHKRLKGHPTGELIQMLEVKILEARLIMDVSERPVPVETVRSEAAVPKVFQFSSKGRSPIVQLARMLFSSHNKPNHSSGTPATLKTDLGIISESSPLAQFKAQELVQIFCLNGRSVRLLLSSPGGQEGEIAIWKGRVYHSEFADLTGDEAFYTIVLMKQAHLQVQELQEEPRLTVSTTWEHLLMEAALRRDTENNHVS